MKSLDRLLTEAEDLCKVYVGRNAESEPWLTTCNRLERIAKLLRRVRKDHPRIETPK